MEMLSSDSKPDHLSMFSLKRQLLEISVWNKQWHFNNEFR